MPDYANGKIYKIVNSVNDKVYIGSTILALPDRMKVHRYQARRLQNQQGKLYRAMCRHGIEKFQIVLIKSAPCSCKSELERIEYAIIHNWKARGVKMYNVRLDGKQAEESKAKLIGAGNGNYGKRGKDSGNFTRGCVTFLRTRQAWSFQWQEDGKRYTKSFSAQKYGEKEAKRLAEEYRDKIYPIE